MAPDLFCLKKYLIERESNKKQNIPIKLINKTNIKLNLLCTI